MPGGTSYARSIEKADRHLSPQNRDVSGNSRSRTRGFRATWENERVARGFLLLREEDYNPGCGREAISNTSGGGSNGGGRITFSTILFLFRAGM